MKFADLHLHTVYSDGTYSPRELIQQAKNKKFSALSITDHDTVEGIAEAVSEGNNHEIEVIPGIELTAEFNGIEVHTLGYFVDYQNTNLRSKLEELKINRVERIYKIVDKLNNLEQIKKKNRQFTAQSVFDISAGGSAGRLHIARAMLKEGLVDSLQEAFFKYIGDNCPAYVCGFRFSPSQAINFIKKYSGIPVLAHPYIFKDDNLMLEFIKFGIMGIEVYYPEHSLTKVKSYLKLAEKFGLLVTGGSDCHGNAKPEVKLGSIRIPYSLVEKLKNAREHIK